MYTRKSASEIKNFYKEFKEKDPNVVLLLSVISLGLYMINWIYLRNKELQSLDPDAPESARGAIIMLIIPAIVYFMVFVLKNVMLSGENVIIGIFEIVIWGISLFLLLKYLFDFCISFGKVTRTEGLIWFFFMMMGVVGIISFFMEFYFVTPLVFFLIISIPAMQAEINAHFRRLNIRKEKNAFYY